MLVSPALVAALEAEAVRSRLAAARAEHRTEAFRRLGDPLVLVRTPLRVRLAPRFAALNPFVRSGCALGCEA